MDAPLAYILELRVRLRGNAEATALVDRCLTLIVRAAEADHQDFPALEGEYRRIVDDLTMRFGAPSNAKVH